MRFPIPAIALAATAALSLALPVRAADPYTFHSMLSLTGRAAFIGKAEQTTLETIQAYVNAHGGIRGRQIAFAIQDDQSTPATGVQIQNQFNSDKVPIVLGPTFTQVCSAVAPLVETKGPVSYCFSPGIHPKPDTYVFSSGVGSHEMADAIARWARLKGWTKIAIISSTDASGQDFEEGLNLALARSENKGVELVAREHFATTDLSVTAQITRIKAAAPQMAIAWTAGTAFGTLLQGFHDVGVTVPIVGGNGNMIVEQLRQYKAFLPRELYFPGQLGLARQHSSNARVNELEKVFFDGLARANAKPSIPSLQDYDPVLLVMDAYRALGFDATPDQLRGWIARQRNWVGINGVYNFAKWPQRGIGDEACVIDRFDATSEEWVPASKPGGYV